MVRSKICGIRSETELKLAVAAGAYAVGFICGTTHFSKDSISKVAVSELVKRTPPYIAKVLVTQLTNAQEIITLANFTKVDTIQIHGLVDYETVKTVYQEAEQKVIKAVHVTGEETIKEAKLYASVCHALLLDSKTAERSGGTGKTHDWSISCKIVEALRPLPVILAGGLTPENVAQAISIVGPYGVDVNSGVEDEAGSKAKHKVEAFIAKASGF